MKITTLKKLLFYINNLKCLDKKIVLVTGCFDILHQAHRQFLDQAKKIGDVLMVGLEGDKRTRKLKGPNRPINTWKVRAQNLASQKVVDFIFPLPEDLDQPQVQSELINQLRPDILAVSSHTLHLDKKRKLMRKYGGQLKIVSLFNPSVSTTKLLSVR